jgi:hypothetical protein
MAHGAVLKFRYGTGQALIQAAKSNWHVFDGWCAIREIDPLELPSRRLYNVIYTFLRENRDIEQLTTLELDLERVAEMKHPYVELGDKINNIHRKRKLSVVPDGAKAVIAPKEKWRAPPGWTPPGWNEEKSYQAAKSFMGFQANPGGK